MAWTEWTIPVPVVMRKPVGEVSVNAPDVMSEDADPVAQPALRPTIDAMRKAARSLGDGSVQA